MLLSFIMAIPGAVVPAQDQSFRALGRNWHTDAVDFVRHDAPKILVILVVAFILQRVVAFFVHRMRRLADAYATTKPQRASQLRTMAAILRATCYGLIGFITILQVLPLFNIDLKPLLASAGVVGLGIPSAPSRCSKTC